MVCLTLSYLFVVARCSDAPTLAGEMYIPPGYVVLTQRVTRYGVEYLTMI